MTRHEAEFKAGNFPIPATELLGKSFRPGSRVSYNGKQGTVEDWDKNEYGAAVYVTFDDGTEEIFASR